mmetsp:Transcript_32033/g.28116  ORF Transcript_32033/g.28116 Transcript_32033/m.28116 type:complete len:85 (+) Transcript_32033:28-282(+)
MALKSIKDICFTMGFIMVVIIGFLLACCAVEVLGAIIILATLVCWPCCCGVCLGLVASDPSPSNKTSRRKPNSNTLSNGKYRKR